MNIRKIQPILVAAAPVIILLACAKPAGRGDPVKPPVQPLCFPGISDPNGGRLLFLKNCAHCHGADAHGDEGPDLHTLDWTDQQIANRIRHGKPGQMPAFEKKLSPANVDWLVAYVRSLK